MHPKVYQASCYELSEHYYCESDDEFACSTSDSFKPIFESKNNLEKKAMKEKVFSSVDQYKNSVHQNIYQPLCYESLGNYYCESDDESPCSSSDFFKPILESKNNLEGKTMKEKVFSSVDQYKNSVHPNIYQAPCYESSAHYYCDSDDESACSTSDFFKPAFESKNNLEGKAMKEKVCSSIDQYKNSKASFSKIYHRWIPERESTLEKLQSLLKEIHDNTTNYYKTQATFKDISYNSRCFKETTENQAMDFFASLAAFVSDAASGITSFAQAFEVDSYKTRLQEILDHDAKITKDLYASRSQCVSQYEGIEEVIRKFNPNTLTSTVGEISSTLLVHKHWAAMKNAYEEDNMSKLLDEVSRFFDNACQSEVLQNVGASVSRFVTDNPAALEACKSTGRAVYGAIDTFSEKRSNRNAAIGYVNKATNLYLMSEDKKEVDHLRSIIDEDTHQSKLEAEVEEAIDSLQDEMREMKEIYFRLFNVYDSD